ncbi:alpha/beta hydrolase family protein [Paenibacillus sp. GCM10012306]|uniref:alpha/beta hydrolase family protein n=1 Tax=Paenibacillus sp. GCM10012306 TaxID=3317342 RepID=UPI003610F156
MESLFQLPALYPVFEDEETGIHAAFYQGVPYKGKETRVFAYYGLPKIEEHKQNEIPQQIPGIILVHGGAGSAFSHWVKQWNDRGYAAIAMDLEGQVPFASYNNISERSRDDLHTDSSLPLFSPHPWSGPMKQGVFADYGEAVQDQWMYHAVAAVLSAHTILRSLPGVDEDRIGITGISWGGIITSLVSGLDHRLSFAMPVYGCGYLYEPGTLYGRGFAAMPPATAERLRGLWDPSSYLHQSKIPMLWLNGSQDTHFPLSIFVKSYEQHEHHYEDAQLHSRLSIQHGLPHTYPDAWSCEESYAFADSITREGPALIRILRAEQYEERVRVCFQSPLEVVKAVLYWCGDDTDWRSASWHSETAILYKDENSNDHGEAHVALPVSGGVYFVQLTNTKGWITSSRVMRDRREVPV